MVLKFPLESQFEKTFHREQQLLCMIHIFSVCFVDYSTDLSGLNTVSSEVLTFKNGGVEENGLSLKPIETECPV